MPPIISKGPVDPSNEFCKPGVPYCIDNCVTCAHLLLFVRATIHAVQKKTTDNNKKQTQMIAEPWLKLFGLLISTGL